MRNFKTFMTAICAVAISGCANTALQQDNFDDVSTDTGGGSDATTSTDTTTADNGCACPLLDNDGDGFCVGNAAVSPSCPKGGGDCDDTPATGFNTHPGAAEICGDGKDNNCNSVIDDGCGTTGACNANTPGFGVTCLNPFGVCAVTGWFECGSNGKLVCSTDIGGSNSKAQPTEVCGNGLDDNCNGQVDEGCGTQTGGNNWIQVDYPSNFNRTLTVQLDTNLEPNGPYWDPALTVSSSGNSLISHFKDPTVSQGQVLHIYFNVDYGTNPSDWYCNLYRGPGKELDANATVTIALLGNKYYLKMSDIVAAKSQQSGCSGRWDLAF